MSASGEVAEQTVDVNDAGETQEGTGDEATVAEQLDTDDADAPASTTHPTTFTEQQQAYSDVPSTSPSQTSSRTLYVVSLPSSCDQLLIESLFEPDEIESIQFSTESSIGGSGMAVSVIFKSNEIANQALEVDGFEIDDGEEKTRIKVLTPEKFAAYLKSMETKRPLEEVRTAPISDSEEGEEAEEAGEGDGNGVVEGTGAIHPMNGEPARGMNTDAQPLESKNNSATAGMPGSTEEIADKQQIEAVSDDEAETRNTAESSSNAQPPSAEEIDDIYVGKRISEYMVANRVNWANVDCIDDVWIICDAISASHGGLPDSLLKEAFLLVVQSNLHQHNSNVWVRQHLQRLLKDWKREVHSMKSSKRPTKFVAASASYAPVGTDEAEPPHQPVNEQEDGDKLDAHADTTQQDDQVQTGEKKKKKRQRLNAKRRKALATLMGVGEILQQARVKFATEDGELQVDEDEYGNISIGGEELTFDSWASLNKIKESGVVHCAPPAKQKKRSLPTQHSELSTPQQALPVQPQLPAGNEANGSGKSKEPSVKKAKLQKPKTEKDEGEISESEDEGASSSGTSSSEESHDDDRDESGASKSRKRRKKRRQTERQTAPSSIANMGSVFSKFYQHRFQIARSLSLQQKALLLDALKQSSSSGNSTQQSQMMMAFMAAFMSSSLAQQNSSSSF